MSTSHSELLRTLDPQEVGARVRAARETLGWTQTQLAGDDVSVAYISRIESGSRRPRLSLLTALAERLGTTVDDLLNDAGGRELEETRLGLGYTQLALESGEAREAEAQARKHLACAQSIGQDDLVLRARFLLARALESQGDLDAAIPILEEILETATGLPLAQAGIALCRCYRETGDLALAIETGERISAALTEAGLDRTDEAVQLTLTAASSYIERGDLHRAARICQATLERAEQAGTPTSRASAAWQASIVQAERGDLASASILASRALALLSEGQDARNLARLRLEVVALKLRATPECAAEAIEQLAAVRAEYDASSASALETTRVDLRVAEAHLLAGDPHRALTALEPGLTMVDPSAAQLRVEALTLRGRALAALGDAEEARAAYQQAVTVLTGAGADRSAAQLWFDLAELLDGIGDHATAREAYRSAAAASGLASRLPIAAPSSVTV